MPYGLAIQKGTYIEILLLHFKVLSYTVSIHTEYMHTIINKLHVNNNYNNNTFYLYCAITIVYVTASFKRVFSLTILYRYIYICTKKTKSCSIKTVFK